LNLNSPIRTFFDRTCQHPQGFPIGPPFAYGFGTIGVNYVGYAGWR
jgi:hypothetical protein